jgi:hypothetical protein
MTHNVRGLPQAVELNDTSGRAAQQIYFYLTARPTRCRLAASLMLAVSCYGQYSILRAPRLILHK